MANQKGKDSGNTNLFDNVKVGKPKCSFVVAKRVLLVWHFGSKLSSGILVEELMSSTYQSSMGWKALVASGNIPQAAM